MSEPNYPHLDKNQPYPLAGILLIDFTHVLSGPTCSRMLALGPHEVPHRIGNRHPDMYPFDTFDCQDQPIAICCGNEVLGSPLKYGTWNSYGLQKDAPKLNEQGEKIRKEFE